MSHPSHEPTPSNDPPRYASTASVATALGVSVTTVKRWVDDGVLPASRTRGGHRKLLVADVLRMAREGQLPAADLSRLMPAAPAPVSVEEVRTRLSAAVTAGNTDDIRTVVLDAYQSGLTVETLADRVLAPVMTQVGHDWETGRLDVVREHQVTQAFVGVLYELRAIIRAGTGGNRPVAVGGSPEGDHYSLPTLLAKLALQEAGWDAVNVGPNTPFSAFSAAVAQFRPRLVWLSVSHLPDPPAFVAQYTAFFRTAEAAGVAVAVGGRALTDAVRQAIPYTSFGDGISHLAAFARSLNARPERPKRGRPASVRKADEAGEPE